MVNDHPEIMSIIFDQINQLSDSLKDSLTAVSSDAINEALEVYSSVKLNSARAPGLKVVLTEMSEFLNRTKKKVANT